MCGRDYPGRCAGLLLNCPFGAECRSEGFGAWAVRKRALSTEAAPGPARVGLGVVGGPATFESVRVRNLE